METAEKKTRGGARPGAGRPKGSKNVGLKEPRKQRQLRAHDDEWALIKRFDKLVKKESKDIGLVFIRNLVGFTEKPYHEMSIAQKIYFLQERINECKWLLIEIKTNPMPNIDDVESVKKNLSYYIEEARKLENILGAKGKIFSGI